MSCNYVILTFQPFILHQITSENTVYIMWLVPQFIVMTAAEIMFSITSLQFSYTQVCPWLSLVHKVFYFFLYCRITLTLKKSFHLEYCKNATIPVMLFYSNCFHVILVITFPPFSYQFDFDTKEWKSILFYFTLLPILPLNGQSPVILLLNETQFVFCFCFRPLNRWRPSWCPSVSWPTPSATSSTSSSFHSSKELLVHRSGVIHKWRHPL